LIATSSFRQVLVFSQFSRKDQADEKRRKVGLALARQPDSHSLPIHGLQDEQEMDLGFVTPLLVEGDLIKNGSLFNLV
jgi:hypothetical protein